MNIDLRFQDWALVLQASDVRQYDDNAHALRVTGDLPAGWRWTLYAAVFGEAYFNSIPLTESGGALTAVLTRDDLAFGDTAYTLQLVGEQGSVRRHTNPVRLYVGASLSGDGVWPEVPRSFTEAQAAAEAAADRAEAAAAVTSSGLSAAGASLLQVPVADGQGGWAWGEQLGNDQTVTVSETVADGALLRSVSAVTGLVLHGRTVAEATGKNLCSLGTVTWTGVQRFSCEPIPAGTYRFSGILASDNTESERFAVSFQDAEGNTLHTKSAPQSGGTERTNFSITLSAVCTAITFYSGGSIPSSQGHTSTWTDLQIESGAATAYEPYNAVGAVGIAPRAAVGGVRFSAPELAQLIEGDTLDLLTGAFYDSAARTTRTVAVTGSAEGLAGNLTVETEGALDVTYAMQKTAYAEDILALVYARIGEKNRVALHAAEEYPLVVGDTFELFWRGVLDCRDPGRYYIETDCDRGEPYEKRFVFTPQPEDVGVHPLSVRVYDDNRVRLADRTIRLRVLPKPTAPAAEKTVLCIGDSLTANGIAVSELRRRLTGTGGTPEGDGLANLRFIGTCTAADGTRFEGYGGWAYSSYLSESRSDAFMWITAAGHDKTVDDQHSVYADANGVRWKLETLEPDRIKLIRVSVSGALPASGTLTRVSGGTHTGAIVYTAAEQAPGNPFWNPDTGAVDFVRYAQQQGVGSIDYVCILLGWNKWKDDAALTADTRAFLTALRAAYPACRICLLGLQIPSADGCALSYGADSVWSRYSTMQHVRQIDRVNAAVAAELENVWVCSVAGQFDSEHNMPAAERPVNARSAQTEPRGTNGVHPAAAGYLQIADAAYRTLALMLA